MFISFERTEIKYKGIPLFLSLEKYEEFIQYIQEIYMCIHTHMRFHGDIFRKFLVY